MLGAGYHEAKARGWGCFRRFQQEPGSQCGQERENKQEKVEMAVTSPWVFEAMERGWLSLLRGQSGEWLRVMQCVLFEQGLQLLLRGVCRGQGWVMVTEMEDNVTPR